jgi:hypothetical protein
VVSEKSNIKDEFERRLHFSAFISTLADVVSKMSPSTLINTETRSELEGAELRSQLQSAYKKWLDLYIHYIEKLDAIGVSYPIEALLGITEAKKVAEPKST